MRLSVIATCLSLCIVEFSNADDAHAAARIESDIPSGGLGPALESLAKSHHFQIVYVTEDIGNAHTQGAVGELTADEALKRLLAGTGLTYRYLDGRTVTIAPIGLKISTAGSAGASAQSLDDGQNGDRSTTEVGNSSSGSFRSAQLDPPAPATTADAGAPAKDSGQISEVVVTAQKRQETVNNTPLAVTALGMAQLQNAGVTEVSDLTASVPNVQIHSVGITDFVGVTIRGVSNLSSQATGNPAVSTYIDGVYVDPPVGFSNDLYDLERVEVLRGPQGTLYGRNATGGNINVITAEPKHNFDANFDASYGNFNDVMTHAMVNMPVSDELAVRGALVIHRNDGLFSTENTTRRNYGAADDEGVRLTGLWTPVEAFKWRLSADGYQSHGTPGPMIETGTDQKPIAGGSPYHQPAYADPEPDNYIQNGALRSRMDLKLNDALSLAYIAGYQHVLWDYTFATLGQQGSPNSVPATMASQQNHATTQGHELNLNFDTEKIKNVVGASYFGEAVGWHYQNQLTAINFSSFSGPRDLVKESWGVFDQATWSPVSNLRFTGGVRYSHDRQLQYAFHLESCKGVPTLAQVSLLRASSPECATSGPGITPAAEGKWSKVSWKGGIDYDLSDNALLYASVTSGYKQGGVQPGLPAAYPSTYEPETVKSYEAGAKLRLLDRTLNIRMAGFFEDYTNIQEARLFFLNNISQTLTSNAGGAHIYGTEFETEWRPTTADYVTAFATWLHARYTAFIDAPNPITGALIPSLAGSQLPNAPEFAVRVEYHHDFGLPNGAKLTPMLAGYWQSTSYTQPLNVDIFKIGAYSRTDAQMTYATPSDHWRFTAYVENLEQHAVRNSDIEVLGKVYSGFNAPRIFGVRAAYSH